MDADASAKATAGSAPDATPVKDEDMKKEEDRAQTPPFEN